jgi:hypothetical protein
MLFVYKNIAMNVESLKDLIPAATEFVLENDRAKYKPFFETAEKFCSENKIIIGGAVGIDLLLRRELTKDSFIWDLYCADTYVQAKNLTDALYQTKAPHVDVRTVVLQTNIKHREFTITIDGRYAFRIFIMDEYRGVVLRDVMNPTEVDGWFGNRVLVLPSTIVLISLYQVLYSPAKIDWWGRASEIANILESGDSSKSGGFDRTIADDILLRSLLKDGRIVLIGDYAIKRMGLRVGGGEGVKGYRLQILTDIPIDELCRMTSRVLTAEKNGLRRMKVHHTRTVYVKYHLNIPSDFQIVKYTVYALVNGEQVALYDTFNSPEYEMIPYTVNDKIRVAAPYVIMRFIYIDIWIIKLLIGMDSGDKVSGFEARITSLAGTASLVREYIAKLLDDRKIDLLFPLDYIGINTSESVAKKKLISLNRCRIPNYYPALKE